MTLYLGIDLGEERAGAVVVDEQGRRVGRAHSSADSPVSADRVLAAAAEALKAAGAAGPAGVGLCTVASARSHADEVRRAAAARWPVPFGPVVSVGTAGAVAEAWCGSAVSRRDVVFLLIDDQVSAGVLIDGRPWSGAHGSAGAAAWLALNPVERQDYRRYGCLAAEVSARGIVRRLLWRVEAGDDSLVVARAKGRLDAVTAADVLQAAREGDGVAVSVVRDTVRYIGMAVVNLAATVDPEVVVLGGLVAEAADLLLQPVRQEVERRLAPEMAAELQIERALLGSDAPAVGAARLAMTLPS